MRESTINLEALEQMLLPVVGDPSLAGAISRAMIGGLDSQPVPAVSRQHGRVLDLAINGDCFRISNSKRMIRIHKTFDGNMLVAGFSAETTASQMYEAFQRLADPATH